jgi:hypothetical protein
LDELKRVVEFAMENETEPDGEPAAPLFVALNVVKVDGQNQSEYRPVQLGRAPEEGAGKNKPFDPLSMKLQ